MKRYFTGGLALLLALNLALPGSTVTLAEDMATSSDMDASMPTATATAMPTATATAASDAVAANPTQARAKVTLTYNGKNYPNGGSVKWLADSTAHPLEIVVENGVSVRTYTVKVTKGE